jgi:hypothetical protein
VNRWQFNKESGLKAAGWIDAPDHEVVTGADPDVDWGDGGTWNLTASLAQSERAGRIAPRFITWGDLIAPMPLPPIPPPP